MKHNQTQYRVLIIILYCTHCWHLSLRQTACGGFNPAMGRQSEVWPQRAPACPDWHLSLRQTAWSNPFGTTQSEVSPQDAPACPDWHLSSRQTAWSNPLGTTQSEVSSHAAPGCPFWHSYWPRSDVVSWYLIQTGWSKPGGVSQGGSQPLEPPSRARWLPQYSPP